MRIKRCATGLLVTAMFVVPASLSAATFVVNNTGNNSDSNAGNGVCRTSNSGTAICTLRAAIQEANATTAVDTIEFAIGSGPQRITLSQSLPSITRPVIIDGWSQPGFAGKPLIEVRGSSGYGDGFKLSGGNSTVRGLIINGFGGDGIILTGTTGNNVIEGNYIGTNADGSAPEPNQETGIRIQSPNNRIGGRLISQRNVVSGNTGRDIMGAIMVYGQSASGNIIQGNYIGLDATGMLPMGNESRGVAIHDSSNNYVGGAQPGAGNLIAANRATGVRIWGGASTGNIVQGNWIGCNKMLETSFGLWPEPGTLSNARGVQSRGDGNYIMDNYILGNSWDGVLFYDGTGKDFDPTSKASNNVVYHNVIAYNGLNGIGAYVGRKNWFISNAIFGNERLGIELGTKLLDGAQPNDLGDGDSGPNDLQNFPVLTSATVSGAQTVIAGTLNSKANKSYQLQFFLDNYCDPWSGHGEAKYYVGDGSVTTNASGNGTFNVALAFALPQGYVVTATATDPDHNTSEVAKCIIIQ